MIQNKYSRWYFAIMAQGDDVSDYVEKHHIIPKSLGGPLRDKSNIILLTARKHFLAHWLLTKFTEGNDLRKMRWAFGAMCKQHQEKRILAAWQYEVAKRANRKVRLSDEEKSEISRKTKEAMSRPEVKAKMGGPQSPEHVAKLAEIRKGKKQKS